MAKRIAIVEDETAIRENYAAAFRREGYVVDDYEARQPALDAFESRLPDLVVIDINLKDDVEGGFELCRELRSRSSDLPIIFLTARDSEFDAVSGLRLGADDYLTKDISLPHLMARIAALRAGTIPTVRPLTDEVLAQPFVPEDPLHLRRARDHVRSLTAEGGTEMLPAMAAEICSVQAVPTSWNWPTPTNWMPGRPGRGWSPGLSIGAVCMASR